MKGSDSLPASSKVFLVVSSYLLSVSWYHSLSATYPTLKLITLKMSSYTLDSSSQIQSSSSLWLRSTPLSSSQNLSSSPLASWSQTQESKFLLFAGQALPSILTLLTPGLHLQAIVSFHYWLRWIVAQLLWVLRWWLTSSGQTPALCCQAENSSERIFAQIPSSLFRPCLVTPFIIVRTPPRKHYSTWP